MRWLFLVSLVVCLPIVSRADVGVFVSGESTLQPPVLAHAEAWLRGRGHKTAPAALSPESINRLIDCFVTEEARCARTLVESRAKADAVLFVQVSVGTGVTAMDRTVTMTAHWIRRGSDTVSERLFCEKCTGERLRETVDRLMGALAANVNNASDAHTDSRSSGARGSARSSPRAQPAEVGERELVRSRASYGWLASGGVLLAGGAVLVALDKDARDAGPSDRRFRDSAPLGFAIGAAGVATAAVGIYLLIRAPISSPVASVSADGVQVAWRGRF